MIPGISHALNTLIMGLFLIAGTALLAPYLGFWLDTFNISSFHERAPTNTASLSSLEDTSSARRGYTELEEMLGRYTEETRSAEREE